jgi:predicted DNA-binding transcriptional regulator YafY
MSGMPATHAKRRDAQMVRILAELGILLEGGLPTVHDLAARFHTRRETIYRDLKVLQDAGYPITGEYGLLSRPRLFDRAKQARPGIRLNTPEIDALLWAAGQAAATHPFHNDLSAASAKLRGMLAAQPEAEIPLADSVVLWQQRGAKDYSGHQATIKAFVEGILRHRRCRVQYRSPAALAPKSLDYDPYRLLQVTDGLYCLGKTSTHADITMLAVERVVSISVTETPFTVAPDFDAQGYQRDAFGLIWDLPMDVAIRFRGDQAPYVAERNWHPSQTVDPQPDGSVVLRFRAGGRFEIVRWILGWGDAAEVLTPVDLRTHVQRLLQAAAGKYEDRVNG